MKKFLLAFCLAFMAIGPAFADDSPKAVQAPSWCAWNWTGRPAAATETSF